VQACNSDKNICIARRLSSRYLPQRPTDISDERSTLACGAPRSCAPVHPQGSTRRGQVTSHVRCLMKMAGWEGHRGNCGRHREFASWAEDPNTELPCQLRRTIVPTTVTATSTGSPVSYSVTVNIKIVPTMGSTALQTNRVQEDFGQSRRQTLWY